MTDTGTLYKDSYKDSKSGETIYTDLRLENIKNLMQNTKRITSVISRPKKIRSYPRGSSSVSVSQNSVSSTIRIPLSNLGMCLLDQDVKNSLVFSVSYPTTADSVALVLEPYACLSQVRFFIQEQNVCSRLTNPRNFTRSMMYMSSKQDMYDNHTAGINYGYNYVALDPAQTLTSVVNPSSIMYGLSSTTSGVVATDVASLSGEFLNNVIYSDQTIEYRVDLKYILDTFLDRNSALPLEFLRSNVEVELIFNSYSTWATRQSTVALGRTTGAALPATLNISGIYIETTNVLLDRLGATSVSDLLSKQMYKIDNVQYSTNVQAINLPNGSVTNNSVLFTSVPSSCVKMEVYFENSAATSSLDSYFKCLTSVNPGLSSFNVFVDGLNLLNRPLDLVVAGKLTSEAYNLWRANQILMKKVKEYSEVEDTWISPKLHSSSSQAVGDTDILQSSSLGYYGSGVTQATVNSYFKKNSSMLNKTYCLSFMLGSNNPMTVSGLDIEKIQLNFQTVGARPKILSGAGHASDSVASIAYAQIQDFNICLGIWFNSSILLGIRSCSYFS